MNLGSVGDHQVDVIVASTEINQAALNRLGIAREANSGSGSGSRGGAGSTIPPNWVEDSERNNSNDNEQNKSFDDVHFSVLLRVKKNYFVKSYLDGTL